MALNTVSITLDIVGQLSIVHFTNPLNKSHKKKFVNWKQVDTLAKEAFDNIDVDLPLHALLEELSVADKQIVAIARAVMNDAKLLIMDEPTTSLTDTEIKRVFSMMKTLKEHNVGIIFISHKLVEVMNFCDRYMVLRDGEMVGEGQISGVNTDFLARLMVGHDVRTVALQRNIEKREEVLRVENLTREHAFREISFSAHRGEVLGITGLLGDGRSELFLSIFGADDYEEGEIYLNGELVKIRNTMDAMKKGIGYLPRNRKENGIIKDMDIFDNGSIVTWPKFARRGIIDFKRQDVEFRKQVDRLRIKMERMQDSINSLSGGNQQKVVLSKWLTANPKLLVLDNPTQGVDVGAKEDIYDIIMDLIDDDIAVIVLSSEAQEIIRVCDRALVMYHGKIQGEVTGSEMNEHNIMKLATGGDLS